MGCCHQVSGKMRYCSEVTRETRDTGQRVRSDVSPGTQGSDDQTCQCRVSVVPGWGVLTGVSWAGPVWCVSPPDMVSPVQHLDHLDWEHLTARWERLASCSSSPIFSSVSVAAFLHTQCPYDAPVGCESREGDQVIHSDCLETALTASHLVL